MLLALALPDTGDDDQAPPHVPTFDRAPVSRLRLPEATVAHNRWIECCGEILRTAAGWDVDPAKQGGDRDGRIERTGSLSGTFSRLGKAQASLALPSAYRKRSISP